MWEFHLLKPSSWTPICHSRDLNISNQPPLTVSSQHPLLPPLLPTQCKEPVQRAFLFFYSCVCECDWAKFSAPVFQPVRSAPCTRLLQSRLKSSSWTAAGGRAAACVMNYIIYYIIIMNYSFTFMLGAHRADTSLHCAPQRFHSLSVVRLRCPGFMSI